MGNLWSVRAELKSDSNVRRVHYKIDKVQEFAYPSLDNILMWCRDACEKLLLELKEKGANEGDLESVEKEIEFLNGCQVDWKVKHEKKVT